MDLEIRVKRGETCIAAMIITATVACTPTQSGDAVCAVDAKGMTACRVSDHEFFLTPDKTALF